MCFDGVKRLCHIRGKLRKKVWINQSDIVLVGLRDYQDAKADVILKYSADEARNLKSYGEFPENVKINETVTFGEEGYDDEIEFDDVSSSEEEGDIPEPVVSESTTSREQQKVSPYLFIPLHRREDCESSNFFVHSSFFSRNVVLSNCKC